MNEQAFFHDLLTAWFILAAAMFIFLLRFVAPYGRHVRGGWGPVINNKTAWVVMESAAPLVFLLCFLLGDSARNMTALAFLGLWEMHYMHRAFIYPFGLRGANKQMPIAIIASGVLFNVVNGYLNGRYLFTFSGGYPDRWLGDIRFIIGAALFIIGFIINRRADQTLRSLRKPGESVYRIPHDNLYRWVSSPNYLGEIVTWIGWAVATWSLPGLAFALWTAANLVPRARAHHAWYRQHFSNYPPERKVLVPHLW